MKASVDKNNYKITLDNEAIKAIRFCNGFTTDLRIVLSKADKSALYDWIETNKLGLFGIDFMDLCVTYESDDWNKYEVMLKNVVRQVIGC